MNLPARIPFALVLRLIPPVVLALFLLLYLASALTSDEPFITVLAYLREKPLLAVLFALIPFSCACRMVVESMRQMALRKAHAGKHPPSPRIFDESVELPAPDALLPVQKRLAGAGYRTRLTEGRLSAWRGIPLFPVRLLMLAALCSLFAGTLLSLTSRESHREPFIEGEMVQMPSGEELLVRRILLRDEPGFFLQRNLEMEVATAEGVEKRLALYPPSLHRGFFVYPRYLGVVPLLQFSAPELPARFESYLLLMIYPPGRGDEAEIPGTPYRIAFEMAEPPGGEDGWVSGRLALKFKLFRGKELLLAGVAPVGGEFVQDGYRLAFPEFKRMVATDLVRDHGVLLIWGGGIALLAALLLWLPLRLWFPRRELLFVVEAGGLRGWSRAEGKRRAHAGVFHEALDLAVPERLSPADPVR